MESKIEHDPNKLRAPTVDASGKRRWIYPDRRSGVRASRRKVLALLLVVFYLAVPYITINDLPLIRLDILAQRASFFGNVFHFHEANYLVFIFLIAAFSLFLVTSLFGRLWCGYACPQTVFVEWLIRPIEEFFEGPAHRRRHLDKQPMNISKFLRKTGKYLAFVFVVTNIANATLAFFIPPETLIEWVKSPPSEHPVAFGFMLFISSALFVDLVWFREQFCSFLCPYARFQALLFDKHTPTITYDYGRGEPRGKKKGSGDCISCGLCERVCPTGIDIKQGLQLECIQCGRCADACDQVMSNLGREKGLIRITSQAALLKRKTSFFRPRPIIYGFILVALLIGFITTLGMRASVDITLLRQKGTTYLRTEDGRLANYYQLRMANRSSSEQTVSLRAPEGVSMICSICEQSIAAFAEERGNLVVLVPADFEDSQIKLERQIGDKKSQLVLPLILPTQN